MNRWEATYTIKLGRNGESNRLQHCWNPISHVHKALAHSGVSRGHVRHADQRHASDSALVESVFTAPEGIVASPAEVTVESGSPIVCEQHQKSLVQHSSVLQCLDESADVLIQIVDHAGCSSPSRVIDSTELIYILLGGLRTVSLY